MKHGNRLIAGLGRRDRQMLLAVGEDVRLAPGAVLFRRGENATSVFFPTAGAVVLAVPSTPARSLGLLLVGAEGMVGMHCVLGDGLSPMLATAHTSASAFGITAPEFSRVMASSHSLRSVMLDYAGLVVGQVAAAAACARCHRIEQRLAGWLLMILDREGAASLHLTHDSLARTLGVRRVGITLAAQVLQRLRLIDYWRGDITIADVAGLKAFAGQSYLTCDGALASARTRRACGESRSTAVAVETVVTSQSW